MSGNVTRVPDSAERPPSIPLSAGAPESCICLSCTRSSQFRALQARLLSPIFSSKTSSPNPGQLEILNNKTYKVVGNVYPELSALFLDNIFHVWFDALLQLQHLVQHLFAENSTQTYTDL
ncbi:hypothetical protein PV04_01932 [Phialophora macrospora]|uniref:Uncharacterized protein n=1 Tax=Phialophora macrospora TaxID=1851006 RepID=A0A0D2G4W8_9EURO|nr:hypothetical protein PV04_01932 [Phialophora macrospora]